MLSIRTLLLYARATALHIVIHIAQYLGTSSPTPALYVRTSALDVSVPRPDTCESVFTILGLYLRIWGSETSFRRQKYHPSWSFHNLQITNFTKKSRVRTSSIPLNHLSLASKFLLVYWLARIETQFIRNQDRVASLITDPQPTSSTNLSKKRRRKKLHVTHNMWHMTCDKWHFNGTCDMWHMEGG